jgi:hypothetical protein
MGCDIHYVVEFQYDSWIGLFSSDLSIHDPDANRRDYAFFAALAGVRGIGPIPLGVPDDASSLTKMMLENWGSDAHSVSYSDLEDFYLKYIRASEQLFVESIKMRMRGPEEYKHWAENILRDMTGGTYDSNAGLQKYRVVFWFDN